MSALQHHEYYDKSKLCQADSINDDIWRASTSAQRAIQDPKLLTSEGEIGAQQAMLSSGITPAIVTTSVLPWVPDLVGNDWRSADALIVVGTAYAGFIREFSGRECCMGLDNYVALSRQSWLEFCNHFIDVVVLNDDDYYIPVAKLVEGVTDFSKLALLDLCRASFVRRGRGQTCRTDSSSQANIKAKPERFSDYVEWEGILPDGTPVGPQVWSWSRIIGSAASCIIALGHVAEHGLLRLFTRKVPDAAIWLRTSAGTKPSINLESKRWPNAYANRWQKLSSWVPSIDDFKSEAVDWWCISGTVNGKPRRWSLFPVYHPADGSTSADYCRRATARLKIMRETNVN
jgi:hypothetical protein